MRSVALESKFESWGDPSLFGPKINEINHPLISRACPHGGGTTACDCVALD